MRRSSPIFGAFALAVSLSVAAHAAASGVEVELRDCPGLSEAALREHLDLELATLELASVDARLVLRCDQTSVAVELYRASGASYPVQARVELRDTAKAARERLVALAASELVAQAERARVSAAARPLTALESRSDRAQPAPERAVGRAATQARPRIELFVAGNAAFSGQPRAALWGGSLGTRWGLTRSWSVLFDTRFERGQESLQRTDVRWTSLSGFAGADLSANGGPLRFSAGLGARAGWLALAASTPLPNEGRSLTAPWVGVALPVRLAFDVGSFVAPFVGVELGYVVVPVRGLDDGRVLIAQRGPWLSGSVGVAVAL